MKKDLRTTRVKSSSKRRKIPEAVLTTASAYRAKRDSSSRPSTRIHRNLHRDELRARALKFVIHVVKVHERVSSRLDVFRRLRTNYDAPDQRLNFGAREELQPRFDSPLITPFEMKTSWLIGAHPCLPGCP
jgi:hypothetical protein